MHLIREIKVRPCLWRKNDNQFKNIYVRRAAYTEIGDTLQTTANAVKAKIRSLRTIFLQNCRKKLKWGQHDVKWEFFSSLLFMKDEYETTGEDVDSSYVSIHNYLYFFFFKKVYAFYLWCKYIISDGLAICWRLICITL